MQLKPRSWRSEVLITANCRRLQGNEFGLPCFAFLFFSCPRPTFRQKLHIVVFEVEAKMEQIHQPRSALHLKSRIELG